MNQALIVNAIFGMDILAAKINQQYTIDIVLNKVLNLFNKKDIYILCDDKGVKFLEEKFNGFKLIKVDKKSAADVLPLIYERVKSYDSIVYLFADEPLIDIDITKKLISLHKEEFADYTYGEGFVRGILPEILSSEILLRLASLDNENKVKINDKNTLFDLLSKDINSFDIETIFADKDLRLMRFELTTSEKRNSIIVERVVTKKNDFNIPYNAICDMIEKNPEIIRTIPSYIEIELTDKIRYSLPYLPIQAINRKRGEMEFEKYKLLLESLTNYANHVYLSVSYLGEPLLYPDIKNVIEKTVETNGVSLILETDGIDFTPDFSNFISSLNSDNLTIIFQIDAIKNDTYKKIHGAEIKYVERNVRYLLSKVQRNVYVQMVRMNMNEDEMLDFYSTWEKEGAGIIIQKYNDFLGLLPKLSDVDLKPLEKICCYHLMRDMVVFFDGNVPRCKQDVNAKYLLGNIFAEPIDEVWKRGEPYFKNYCLEKYDEDCRRCDEYYIFNF